MNNQCSQEERELLERFLESYQEKEALGPDFRFSEVKEELWQRIKANTGDVKKRKVNFNRLLFKYAAVSIGLAAFAVGFNLLKNDAAPASNLIIEDRAIVLRTADNRLYEIEPNAEGKLITDAQGKVLASQSKGQMIYRHKPSAKQEYNELIVPKGKTFKLMLSDGTLAHLNADTSLKYPVSFVKGRERKVFLKGEAYFEVAKDPNRAFTVVAEDMNVHVLGTHFNVSSYANEEAYTVLAEGRVAISDRRLGDKGGTHILKPGQKASVQPDTLMIREVDINDYLNWRNGDLTFNNEPFEAIIKKIERRYGVHIENWYTELGPVRFRGAFKNETIQDLLDTFKESAEFDYEITDNSILIKKPV